jgi:hypothetical protein
LGSLACFEMEGLGAAGGRSKKANQFFGRFGWLRGAARRWRGSTVWTANDAVHTAFVLGVSP